jgi:hypothetical protein
MTLSEIKGLIQEARLLGHQHDLSHEHHSGRRGRAYQADHAGLVSGCCSLIYTNGPKIAVRAILCDSDRFLALYLR